MILKTANKLAFTLLELMVVIFIIIMLLSFLVPSFTKMQKKADEIYCVNNYKQMASLFLMYSSDYDGRLPSVWSYRMFGRNVGLSAGWQGKLASYLVEPNFYEKASSDQNYIQSYKNGGAGYEGLSIFLCRSALRANDPVAIEGGKPLTGNPDARRISKSSPNWAGRLESIPTSYSGVDGFFDDPKGSTGGLKGTKPHNDSTRLSVIKRPSEKIILVESANRNSSFFALYDDNTNFLIDSSRHDITKHVKFGWFTQGYLNSFTPNFLHDDIEEMWVSNASDKGYSPEADMNKYYGVSDRRYVIVTRWKMKIFTYDDPANFSYFDKVLSKYSKIPVDFSKGMYFFEDIYQFMMGDMNVLFADMHVAKKSDRWLHLNFANAVRTQ